MRLFPFSPPSDSCSNTADVSHDTVPQRLAYGPTPTCSSRMIRICITHNLRACAKNASSTSPDDPTIHTHAYVPMPISKSQTRGGKQTKGATEVFGSAILKHLRKKNLSSLGDTRVSFSLPNSYIEMTNSQPQLGQDTPATPHKIFPTIDCRLDGVVTGAIHFSKRFCPEQGSSLLSEAEQERLWALWKRWDSSQGKETTVTWDTGDDVPREKILQEAYDALTLQCQAAVETDPSGTFTIRQGQI